jgi:hypothetical protein
MSISPNTPDQPGEGYEQAEERHRHLGRGIIVMVGQHEADGCRPHGYDWRDDEHGPYLSTTWTSTTRWP